MSEPQREYRQVGFQAPPGSTELLLVRHGESAAARPGEPFAMVDGHGDPELAPDGRHQAERVAARLGSQHIDGICVTTLRRTVQTAEPLARALDLTPVVVPGLREVHLGDWEGGLFRQKLAERDPLILRMYAEQRWDVIPGAEPADRLAGRVRAAVDGLAAANPGKRLAVFTHSGIIGQVLSLATGAAPFAFTGSDNGSISHLVVDGPRWIVRRFNDTAHLDPGFGRSAEPPL